MLIVGDHRKITRVKRKHNTFSYFQGLENMAVQVVRFSEYVVKINLFYIPNYLFQPSRLSVHPSVCVFVCLKTNSKFFSYVTKVTNKSFLECVNNETYAFWVTPRPLPGVQEAKQSRASYIDTHFSVSSTPQCQSQAVVCIS